MVTKIIILIGVFQIVTSQRLLPPINYPPLLNDLLAQCSQTVLNLSPAESDTICKNFASSIQNVVLEKFAQNCLRKPVFSQIAGPLINEVATNVCKCPVCSAVNLGPKSYSKTYITPATVSNIINNANSFVNYVPDAISNANGCVNNVPNVIRNANGFVNNVPNNVPVNALVNNAPNNVPVNFIIASNSVRPTNNVQITELLSLLKGLNECSCRGAVV